MYKQLQITLTITNKRTKNKWRQATAIYKRSVSIRTVPVVRGILVLIIIKKLAPLAEYQVEVPDQLRALEIPIVQTTGRELPVPASTLDLLQVTTRIGPYLVHQTVPRIISGRLLVGLLLALAASARRLLELEGLYFVEVELGGLFGGSGRGRLQLSRWVKELLQKVVWLWELGLGRFRS